MAAAVCPAPGEPVFSLDRFLAEGATLYLLGSDRPHASIAPLFTAITGYIFEGAKRAAGQSSYGSFHGRLPKPLSLILDEVALICPVPLHKMMADCGGRGIQLMAAVQSLSQLHERWGERSGKVILDNSNAKLVFGGLGDAAALRDLSELCGHRDDRVRQTSTGTGGQHSASFHVRQVPVLGPHELRQIPDGQALLLYRNIPPMIVKTERVWDRKDVKKELGAQRNGVLVTTQAEAVRAVPEATKVPADVLSAPNIVAFPGPRADDDQDEDTAARAKGEN